jgi:hypothetical protein
MLARPASEKARPEKGPSRLNTSDCALKGVRQNAIRADFVQTKFKYDNHHFSVFASTNLFIRFAEILEPQVGQT